MHRWLVPARRPTHHLLLEEKIPVRNVTEEAGARAVLRELAGKDQGPCLVIGGKPLFESGESIRYLVSRTTNVGS